MKKRIKILWLRICQAIDMARSNKTDLRFTKIIYDWERKTQSRIFQILDLEVTNLLEKNKGYKLRGFKPPIHCRNGSIVYKIILKKRNNEPFHKCIRHRR